jgi:hypothetical protein
MLVPQISLGGGMPNPAMFPVTGATFDLGDGTHLRLEPDLVRQALQYSPTVRVKAPATCRCHHDV